MAENKIDKKIFNQRIDTYGQALAIYVFVFIIFSVIYGTLHDGEFRIVFSPLVIVMFGIICVGVFLLLLAAIKKKQIIIDENIIEIRNRFRSVKFSVDDIMKMSINKSPTVFVKENISFVKIRLLKENACFIKIKLYKKKTMLVRAASFYDYEDLVKEFYKIMKEHLLIKKERKRKTYKIEL